MADAELAATKQELAKCKAELETLRLQMPSGQKEGLLLAAQDTPRGMTKDEEKSLLAAALTVVVIGASGDLAKKKTFPALFALHVHGLLPPGATIAGYARSKMTQDEFKEKISTNFTKNGTAEQKKNFLSRCHYFAGQYDSAANFAAFDAMLQGVEGVGHPANRVFYLAIPPTLFVKVGKGIQPAAMSKSGWNRVIVEKPFGRDSESSAELGSHLSALFAEDQLYRIDHYLGKEMVQNVLTTRFANEVFEPIWNRNHVKAVVITFKENFGTQGRGGYFDSFGIIRDVLQNHLLQMLSLVAMEAPVSSSAEHVRDEKVKLLRAIRPITLADTVLGQYKADPDGKEPSYLDDPTVPNDSVTPTYALTVLHIDNNRWSGVPFILKAGKALDERKAEVRIQFRQPVNGLFKDKMSNNELVMRVQPNEAVYLKMTTKKPGLEGGVVHTELDLSYKDRFDSTEAPLRLPDAYERLIFDVIRGDHNLFVRSDELEAAWRIFTPLLHKIEGDKVKPSLYDYGGRGPAEADKLVEEYGYERTSNYSWSSRESRSRNNSSASNGSVAGKL